MNGHNKWMIFSVTFLLTGLAACGGSSVIDTGSDEDLSPEANAGANQTLAADYEVVLDGRASYDPEGRMLTYHWSFDSTPMGSNLASREAPFAVNHDNTGVTEFQPDAIGVYVVALQVDDGYSASTPSYVLIETTEPEGAPTADAGVDIEVEVGELVTLSGAQSSDALGGSLTYDWELATTPENSDLDSASVSGSDTISASFTPDVRGSYIVTLMVDNGLVTSIPDAVTVTVSGDDEVPTAITEPTYFGEDCTPIPLDCAGSTDPDGDSLSYYWDMQLSPENSNSSNDDFSDQAAASPTFWADSAGDYLLSCSVNDGNSWSTPATVEVALTERKANTSPEVFAGTDYTEILGEAECVSAGGASWTCDSCPGTSILLGDGGYVVDPDGDPMTVLWEITEGDAELVTDDEAVGSALLGDVAPTQVGQCKSASVKFKVTATDCPGDDATDTITVTAQCCGVAES